MCQIKISVNGSELSVASGQTLLETIQAAEIPIDTACGGQARCHLCRVTITAGREQLPKADAIEYKALGNVLIAQGMRLACQIEVNQPLSVTVPEPRARRRRAPAQPTRVPRTTEAAKAKSRREPRDDEAPRKKRRRRRRSHRRRNAENKAEK